MSRVYRHSDGSYHDVPEVLTTGIPFAHSAPETLIKINEQSGKILPDGSILVEKEIKGLKFDSEKAPIDLIPHDSIIEIAKVLQAGEKKYGTANWANGIEIRRLLSASMRHIGQFNNGEDMDEETQTLHIANAATNLIFAIWMMKNRPDMDNRWIKGIKK